MGQARRHWKDWIAIVILLGLLTVTEETGVGKRMYISDHILEQIKFPFGKSTVPSWSVPFYNLVGPPVVIAVHAHSTGRTSLLSHHGIMGSLFSTSSSALITNILKITVGRPRPNFFYRCWPDGVESFQFDGPDRVPLCSPKEEKDVIDGYKSFPSGHTSWSFGAMGFLSLYFFHFWRVGGIFTALDLVVVMIPVTFATWVGCTRVIDYYHNASDVVAGGLIGAAIAVLTFYVIYPWGKVPSKHVREDPPEASETAETSDADTLPV